MPGNLDDPPLLPPDDHPQRVRAYVKERVLPVIEIALEDLLREVTARKRQKTEDLSPLIWLSDYLRQFKAHEQV